MIFVYIYLMLIFSFKMFLFSLYLLINLKMYYFEFEIMKLISIKFEYLLLIDWISVMFVSLVMFISSMVMLYSIEYMMMDLNINRFMYLILSFITSMILMIFSPNMFSILMGWDGLGLVSYCLVIYYQNESSYNSGMITVLMNRIGDVMILMFLGLSMFKGSWNILMFNDLNNILMLLILIAALTKSAQIPFSSWLPLAMAAPTPISSLVHSSTLVTAGVYLLIRFNYLMIKSSMILNLMMIISVMTMFMAGFSANYETDLKKIIALSTLSQLAVMIFSLSLGFLEISFFHLIIHALFKSMLFMCAGIMIHNMLNNQDIRNISMLTINMPLISMIFNCSSLSLCGIPFMSGFYSKDLILEMFMMGNFNKFIFIILFMSMGFTLSYSWRLMYYSFCKFNCLLINIKFMSLSSIMFISMIMLYFKAIIGGSMLMWLLFSSMNFIFLSFQFKMMIFYIMMISIILVNIFIKFFYKYLILNKMMIFYYFMNNLWFMLFIYIYYFNKLMYMSNKINYLNELGWNEYLLGELGLNKILKIMFNEDLYFKNYFFLIKFILYFLLIMMF